MCPIRCRTVDQESTERFAVLWTKAQPTVAGYVGSVVPDVHRAEDVLHQVALVLVRKFAQYDDQQPFVRWALGVARLEVLKDRQRHATEKHVFSTDVVEQIADSYAETAVELDARRQALRHCLEQVQGRGRVALRLRYIDGLKPAAISARLSMSVAATRTLLSRVRSSLRECITRRAKEQAAP